MESDPGSHEALNHRHREVYQLMSKAVALLWLIFGSGALAFVALVTMFCVAEWKGSDSASDFQVAFLGLWDQVIPLAEVLLRLLAPVIILLLVINFISGGRYQRKARYLGQALNDLPSVLALIIVVTICLLPLTGIGVPEVLSNVALVVVGFYFGKRETAPPRKEDPLTLK